MINNVPTHIAIIPDGNRRWAKEKGLPTFEGHRRGAEVAIDLGKKARQLGIRVLTLWAFSTENWNRKPREVELLIKLYGDSIDRHLKEALKEEIKIIHLGRKERIPSRLKRKIEEAEKKTEQFTNYYLCIALDYGGRDEIIRSIEKIKNQKYKIKNINADIFDTLLDTHGLPYPNPDLVIRTSGEMRTSGFMLWQAAYAEYIFVDKYFPAFTTKDLEQCVAEYGRRKRRFGR